MTKMIAVPLNELINPLRLPFEARVAMWSVSYHRTAAAAERRAKREAAAAARHCGGPAPKWQVNRVAIKKATSPCSPPESTHP